MTDHPLRERHVFTARAVCVSAFLILLLIPLRCAGAQGAIPGGPCWTVRKSVGRNGAVIRRKLCAPHGRTDCYYVRVMRGRAVRDRILCPPHPGCRIRRNLAAGGPGWDWACP